MVQPDTAQILELINSTPGPKLYELPPADARAMYLEMGRQLDLPPDTLHAITDLEIEGAGQKIGARLYTPVAGAEGPVLVYFHGGGWVIGDLESHHGFCVAIARQLQLRVLAVDYRLAPEHRFPAAHDDCLAVAKWAATSPVELGAPVAGIALAGDSAGGNLAIATSMALSGAAKPLAQLLLYPATDLAEQSASYHSCGEGYLLDRPLMEWFCNAYAPDAAQRADPRLSSLRADDLSGTPPTVMLTCGLDPLRDEGRAFAARLITAGVEVHFSEAEGQIHGIATLRGAISSGRAPLAASLQTLDNILKNARSESTG